MAILLEARGTDSELRYLFCDECNTWEHRYPGARLRHSKRCDSKEQPTPEQTGATAAKPAPIVVRMPGAVSQNEYLANANTRANTYKEAASLRRSGHSWQDINNGNHDH